MAVNGCDVITARLTEWEVDGYRVTRQEILGYVDGVWHLSVTGWVGPKEVARVKAEPHDPYRNLQPTSTLLPGQLLVKLPGDEQWRHLGLMADPLDAAEIAWRYRQQDTVRAYAWVDGEGQLVDVSNTQTF